MKNKKVVKRVVELYQEVPEFREPLKGFLDNERRKEAEMHSKKIRKNASIQDMIRQICEHWHKYGEALREDADYVTAQLLSKINGSTPMDCAVKAILKNGFLAEMLSEGWVDAMECLLAIADAAEEDA